MIEIKTELKAIVDKATKIKLAKQMNSAFKNFLGQDKFQDRFKVSTKIIEGHIIIAIQCIEGQSSDLINLWDGINKFLSNKGFVRNDDYEIDMRKNILAIDFNPFIQTNKRKKRR